MGKSLNGKELGKGLSQRKDGLYQGRFVNRFGKKQTVYAKTLNEVRQKLRNEQYEDEKALNVVAKDVTLDEWYESGWIPARRIAETPPRRHTQVIIAEYRRLWDGENSHP